MSVIAKPTDKIGNYKLYEELNLKLPDFIKEINNATNMDEVYSLEEMMYALKFKSRLVFDIITEKYKHREQYAELHNLITGFRESKSAVCESSLCNEYSVKDTNASSLLCSAKTAVENTDIFSR